MKTPAPVQINERHQILDVLRGFALLGVMIDNIFGFTGWGYSTDQSKQSLTTWPADAVLATLEQVFVSGKFYSLFSMLFGVGFSVILLRNEAKGVNPLPLFYRRLFILMLIGAFHLFFLWEGDILFIYALIGCALPLFRNLTDRNLLILAVTLLLSPIVIDLVAVLLDMRFGNSFTTMGINIDKVRGIPEDKAGYSTYLFSEGSGWREWQNWMASGWAYRFGSLTYTNRAPKVLAMFLLGFYVGRRMMYVRLNEHIELLKKLRFWGLLIGIPMNAVSFYFEYFQKNIPDPIGLVHTAAYAFSVVPMSLAYTSIVCLHWLRTDGNTRMRYLAPVGQMALTNYIMQTLIGIFIYYGVGLGLGGNIGPAIFIPAGILVYFVQVMYSNWWMKRFQYGPLEWVWRQLTYGKRLPLRK